VTTIQGELVPRTDTTGNARRKQKVYEDILGRQYKTEAYEWDGSTVYSTVVNTFNGRDQVLQTRQYAGSTSATTYQDSTATFDGFGRLATSHKPEQRDSSDNLKYTQYSYNPDDSIKTVTDGRGAVTTYTYGYQDDTSSSEKRGLLTKIAYSSPETTNIPDPADVSFVYDSLGNRTSMADGMGNTAYAYDSLSRMISETRDFNDSLPDGPLVNGNQVFQLSYTYSISGLKSYTDPYGKEIAYARDTVGRISTVTGSPFGGVTTYANNPAYRVWGAVKHLEYGSGYKMDKSFNNRLQPLHFTVDNPSDSLAPLFDVDYEYYNDGRTKLVDNTSSTAEKFDRFFTYDFLGRVKGAKSGIEAHGQTQTTLSQLPYRQTYTFDAFGNNTGRTSTLWTNASWNYSYSYTIVTRTTEPVRSDPRTTMMGIRQRATVL
jgi:YD repeat-containing protein